LKSIVDILKHTRSTPASLVPGMWHLPVGSWCRSWVMMPAVCAQASLPPDRPHSKAHFAGNNTRLSTHITVQYRQGWRLTASGLTPWPFWRHNPGERAMQYES
jgi:hypothetical protein